MNDSAYGTARISVSTNKFFKYGKDDDGEISLSFNWDGPKIARDCIRLPNAVVSDMFSPLVRDIPASFPLTTPNHEYMSLKWKNLSACDTIDAFGDLLNSLCGEWTLSMEEKNNGIVKEYTFKCRRIVEGFIDTSSNIAASSSYSPTI